MVGCLDDGWRLGMDAKNGIPVDSQWTHRIDGYRTIQQSADEHKKAIPTRKIKWNLGQIARFSLVKYTIFPKKREKLHSDALCVNTCVNLSKACAKFGAPNFAVDLCIPKAGGSSMANLACSFFSRFCTGKYIRWVNLGTCITDINLPFNSRKYNHFVFFYHVPRCN